MDSSQFLQPTVGVETHIEGVAGVGEISGGLHAMGGREGGGGVVYRFSRSWIPVTRFCA